MAMEKCQHSCELFAVRKYRARALPLYYIMLPIVTVWQFRGCMHIKLIYGYNFIVIYAIDTSGERFADIIEYLF